MEEKKEKVGLMGGTFNPIHTGHLLLAETAYEQFELDKVLIMPAKNPYHKRTSGMVSDEMRIDMIKCAIDNNPHFELSFIEFEREGNTYTVDTLKELNRRYPKTEFYFIMGADSLYQFAQWKEPAEILKRAVILAASRDNIASSALNSQIHYLLEQFGIGDIRLLQSPNMEISSHDIRNRVKEHRSIRYLIPEAVREYIENHQLYQEKE
ncbi:MAG: nicotinate-nucleotide adenylyltransferase [Clostridiales bacterium]|nr:nicotinate-nucleotide adenylyltransferase [Clostridiales bacterium]